MTKREELHDRLQEYYNWEIFMYDDLPSYRTIYSRVGTDKKVIIKGNIFRMFPVELILTVIVVKGWLL